MTYRAAMSVTGDDVVATHRWHGTLFGTVEDFILSRRGRDWVLSGSVTGAADHDVRITYEVVADDTWATRRATFDASVDGVRRVGRLENLGDRWEVDGSALDDLDGCTDVDLGWTPATNTLPIRRLAAAGADDVDDPTPVGAAWVRMPDLHIVRLDQTYTRRGPHTWRYRSGGFEAELSVDEFGLVTRYGVDGLWVSTSGG